MSRPLRILALIWDDPDGEMPPGALYRVRNPFLHLHKHNCETRITVWSKMGEDDYDWFDVLVLCDVYPLVNAGWDTFVKDCRDRGQVLVLDLPDNQWAVEASNPDGGNLRRDIDHLTHCARTVDLLTVTTEALRRQVRQYNHRVRVLPNCFDLAMWDAAPRLERDPDVLTIGVQGLRSHYEDWRILAEVWPVIAREYPQTRFVVAGALPDYLARFGETIPGRFRHLPPVKAMELPALLSEARMDIGCAPLRDTVFNQGKSPIKVIEYALSGAASVASPTVYATELPWQTHINARTVNDWIVGICGLIDDRALRNANQLNAEMHARRLLDVEKYSREWANVYREAWERKNR
jgi:glycosyltransferase involved in cell wall biosynthesis